MKRFPKPYIYLIITLVAVTIVWFLEKPTEEKKGDILGKPFFENLDTKMVEQIEIEHLFDGVRLKKENGEWKVTAIKTKMKENTEAAGKSPPTPLPEKWYIADSSKVDLGLEILTDLDAISLAGNNPEKHGYFEVNAVGMQVRLYDDKGKKIAHIYIGKAGAAFLESYARKDQENEVYLTNRYLRTSFPPDVNSWRDHKIWDMATGNIEGLQVERDKNSFALKKEAGKWKLAQPQIAETDTAKVENLINQLSKIMATGFEEEAKKEMGLDKPTLKITLQTNTHPFVLKLGREKDKNTNHYYAEKEGDPQIYLVLGNILKTIPEDWKSLTLK